MIFKKRLQNRFTAISNEICTNTSISTDARWCLWYLLTKPEDWEVRINDIRQVSGWGRDKVKSAINELVAAKYVVKRQERAGRGQFDVNIYDVYEFPVADYPLTENPLTVEPLTENTSLNKDLKKQKTEKTQKTEEYISAQAEFDEFWAAYPKRPGNPKAPAIAKYVNARQKLKVSHETLLQAAKAYAVTRVGEDPKFTAQAVTWLNQRRWEDYDGSAPEPQPKATISDEAYRAVTEHYPGKASEPDEAKRLMAAEVNKGAKSEDIAEAAHKFKLLVKQARNDGHDMAVPILETWLKFKWRDMDAYEFYRGGMTMKLFVRPKRGK
jgi:hypothetical protein